MKVIWKQVLQIEGTQDVPLPVGAEFLSVQNQRDEICFWYKCDPAAEKKMHRFFIAGTGHQLPHTEGQYMGTVQVGSFVWHVFFMGT